MMFSRVKSLGLFALVVLVFLAADVDAKGGGRGGGGGETIAIT